MKKILLVLPILFFAAACNLKNPPPVSSPAPVAQQQIAPSTGPTADWKIYTNTEYGFQLTLTDAWKGYRVVKKSPVGGLNDTYALNIEVPIKDKTYGDGSGYAAPLIIVVYSKTAWTQALAEGGPHGTYLAENANYVFAYGRWQDAPPELMNTDFQVPGIITSFKLLK